MKKLVLILLLAGLHLLSACKMPDTAEPTKIPENPYTPTPIEVLTGTPTTADASLTPSPTPAKESTPFPTVTPETMPTAKPTPVVTPSLTESPVPSPVQTPEPTESPVPSPIQTPEPTEPSPTQTPEPTETPVPSPTQTPEPTETPVPSPTQTPEPTEPSPTQTPEPKETPVPSPTQTPEPTEPSPTQTPEATETLMPSPTLTLEPTSTPVPTATPTPIVLPTATPTPVISVENLLQTGWQMTESIQGDYKIIFPELFDDTYVIRGQQELVVGYASSENNELAFYITYTMGQSLEETLQRIEQENGLILSYSAAEKTGNYLLQDDTTMYQGVALENQYAKEFLGADFGEENMIVATMQVIFAYPKEKEEYSAEQYRFFVIPQQ